MRPRIANYSLSSRTRAGPMRSTSRTAGLNRAFVSSSRASPSRPASRYGLAPLELGLAPLRQGSGSLAEVLGHQKRALREYLQFHEGHLVEAVAAIDDPFCEPDGSRRVAGHLARQLFSRANMSAGFDHAVRKSDSFRFIGVDKPRGHDQFLRARVSDRARQPCRSADVGHQADAYLRHPHPRAFRDDPRVTGQRDFQAEAARIAMDSADHRFLDRFKPVERRLRFAHEVAKAREVRTPARS